MEKIEEIKRKIKEIKPLIREGFKVKKIGIFGSYTRKEQKKRSDLDVLVEFKKTIGLFDFIRLENFLSQELGVKVDLVMKEALKPRIKETVINEAIYV